MAFDWTQYASGGALRPDSFTGMKPEFSGALQQLFMNAPPEIQKQLQVYSGYRSPERQAELWKGALAKYGSPEAARKWVAPPGRSNHGHGQAADLRFLDRTARDWAHSNASKYGLAFPLGNEPWHIELASARGGNAAPQEAKGLAALVNRPQDNNAAPVLPPPRTIADRPIAEPQTQTAQNTPPNGILAAMFGDSEKKEGGGLMNALMAMQPQEAPQAPPMPQQPQGPTLADLVAQFMQSRNV